jgi:flagellum-specific ATP synthase
VSRLAQVLQDDSQKIASQKVRSWLSIYNENKDLLTVGAYQAGQNRTLDESIQKKLDLDRFLQQGMNEPCDMATSVDHLKVLSQPPQHELQGAETIQG